MGATSNRTSALDKVVPNLNRGSQSLRDPKGWE